MSLSQSACTDGKSEAFFETLQAAKVDLLVDIRRRRGVRGPDYPFANSMACRTLSELGIGYLHRIDLSPSDALRKRQHEVDESEHMARRQRTELSAEFDEGYRGEVLTISTATCSFPTWAETGSPRCCASSGNQPRATAACSPHGWNMTWASKSRI